MKISDLIRVLEEAKEQFGDDTPVYFDTEARTFEYHMAKIGSIYYQEHPDNHVSLHEAPRDH